MVAFRALEDAERVAFQEAWEYGFAIEDGPGTYDSPADTARRIGDLRGLFLDSELVAVCQLHEFSAPLRGSEVPVGGIASIVVLPEHRGEGHGRRLLEAANEEFRDRGAVATLLWPFSYRYYRQFGWGQAESRVQYAVAPSDLPRVDAPATGCRIDSSAVASLDEVYRDFVSPYDLAMARSELWWTHQVLDEPDPDRYAYLFETGSEPVGYLVFRGEDGGSRLAVSDLAYRDQDALASIVEFLRHHDSQVDRITFEMPERIGLLDAVPEPGAVSCSIGPGAMVRLIDVESALSVLEVPESRSESLAIALSDPFAEDRPEPITLSFDSGAVDYRPARTDQPDARVGMATFSQLVAGAIDVDRARRTGDLTGSEAALSTLDDAFPPRPTHVPDRF